MHKSASLEKINNLVFVFWGEYFEEATATIFASKLRQVGLCVKIVGLMGQQACGKNGVALLPDLSLRDALSAAEKAICIVLPCSAATLKHVEADPRVGDLFHQAYANGARFVVSSRDLIEKTGLKKLFANDNYITTYEEEGDLLQYAEELAKQLALQFQV